MAARQFGFVVCRGLAVYCFLTAVGLIYTFALQKQMEAMWPDRPGKVPSVALIAVAGMAVHILLAAFLWTNAHKFAGDTSDDQPSLRAGNWVVRLAFTCFGIYIALGSLNSLARFFLELSDPLRFRPYELEFYLNLTVEGAKFLVGLGLFLYYRFDKRAALQAAQALEKN
jgi:hypothetical protein